MARADKKAYFKRTSLMFIVTVGLSMGYFAWTVFWPHTLPYDRLGPLGSLSLYLVEHHHPLMCKGWWLAWGIHAAEAFYSLRLCSYKGVSSRTTQALWFIQTLLFGFASLRLLLSYNPDARPKRQ